MMLPPPWFTIGMVQGLLQTLAKKISILVSSDQIWESLGLLV
jgi:hypothetical protein